MEQVEEKEDEKVKKEMEIKVQIEGWKDGSGWQYNQDLDPFTDEVEVAADGTISYDYTAEDYIHDQNTDGGDVQELWESQKSLYERGEDTLYTLYVYNDEDEKIELSSCYESKWWKEHYPEFWEEIE